jgi:glutaredoxin 3
MKNVTIYFKVPCAYCDHAKRLLQAKNIPYDAIDLTDSPEELQKIKNDTGWRTVPVIMIDGKLIGGYSDLKALDDAGQLDTLVK